MEEKRSKNIKNDNKDYELILKCAYVSYLIKSDKLIVKLF